MQVSINDIAYYLPPDRLSNTDLNRLNPEWDMDKIEAKTGIVSRFIASSGQTAMDMGLLACRNLFDHNPGLADRMDAVIFCTTTPDQASPQNSYLIHKKLDLPDRVFCLDIGMACSGFVYSMAVARGIIATGVATDTVIINSDLMSRHIDPHDRSCKCLFSDGASAVWISKSQNGHGIIDMDFGARGKSSDAAYIPGWQKNTNPSDTGGFMVMDGKKLLALAGSKIPRQVKQLLKKNSLALDDVDHFIFHQGSKLVVDALQRLLKIPDQKLIRHYAEIGNTSSASIPIALKHAWDQKKIHPGNLILISGFGLGFSWGSALLRI